MNKLAQREHVIYLPIVSGSNDTTGKDCVRYSFRQCFYAQTAAAALTPVIIKELGKNKKIAFLTPDYTYGHTVRQSFEEATKKQGGWTVATNQVCPLGASDYSSYLLNIANSGADVFININFGNDAVQSIKQAKQFGVLDKMTLVVAYNTPFLARDVGPDLMQGVLTRHRFLVDAGGSLSRSPRSSSRRSRRSTTTSRNGAPIPAICRSRCGPTR